MKKKPILQLVTEAAAAEAAGKRIAPADAARIEQYHEELDQFFREMSGEPWPAEWSTLRWTTANSKYAQAGSPYDLHGMIVQTWRTLPKKNAKELRELARWLLGLLALEFDAHARQVGQGRTERDHRRNGAIEAAITKKLQARTIADAIDELKQQRNGTTSDTAAARLYLAANDEGWLTTTDPQKTRKVQALVRRVTRARKNSGH